MKTAAGQQGTDAQPKGASYHSTAGVFKFGEAALSGGSDALSALSVNISSRLPPPFTAPAGGTAGDALGVVRVPSGDTPAAESKFDLPSCPTPFERYMRQEQPGAAAQVHKNSRPVTAPGRDNGGKTQRRTPKENTFGACANRDLEKKVGRSRGQPGHRPGRPGAWTQGGHCAEQRLPPPSADGSQSGAVHVQQSSASQGYLFIKQVVWGTWEWDLRRVLSSAAAQIVVFVLSCKVCAVGFAR